MSVHSTTIHPLCFYPSLAPRKKFRGRRRYFDRIQRSAETLRFAVEPLTTYNLWHHHVDWPGWGNLGWRHRLPHLRALCTVFRQIVDAHGRFAIPFQTWIMIAEEDARHDAVYVHSLNSNGAPFPFHPKEVEASALAPCLRQLLPELDLRVGWSRVPDKYGVSTWNTTHWVWVQGVGIPLWAG
jgi:hypothetical protein